MEIVTDLLIPTGIKERLQHVLHYIQVVIHAEVQSQTTVNLGLTALELVVAPPALWKGESPLDRLANCTNAQVHYQDVEKEESPESVIQNEHRQYQHRRQRVRHEEHDALLDNDLEQEPARESRTATLPLEGLNLNEVKEGENEKEETLRRLLSLQKVERVRIHRPPQTRDRGGLGRQRGESKCGDNLIKKMTERDRCEQSCLLSLPRHVISKIRGRMCARLVVN